MLGEVAKFGGNWPGENGMANTWKVPKYNVDFSRAAEAAIGELLGAIDDEISAGKARPSPPPPWLDSSVNWKLLKSSANTTN